MRIFKAMIERVEIEKKWLPLIHTELRRYNESVANLNHNLQANFHDLKHEIERLAKNEAEFIEVIRHFFALSKDLKTQELKRKAQEEDESKPGKHDDLF